MDSRRAIPSASNIVIHVVALAPTVTAVVLQSIHHAILTGKQGHPPCWSSDLDSSDLSPGLITVPIVGSWCLVTPLHTSNTVVGSVRHLSVIPFCCLNCQICCQTTVSSQSSKTGNKCFVRGSHSPWK